MENGFENVYRLDPTKELRRELAEDVRPLAKTPEDEAAVEKFIRGLFFIPSDTYNRVSELIHSVGGEEKRRELRKLFNRILDES